MKNSTTICLIGGSGFIGTRLAKKLEKDKIDFIIIDKEKSITFPQKTIIADVRNSEQIKSAIPQDSIIINLAAEHRDDVKPNSLYYDVNVEGAKNIVSACEEKNIRKIIFTSSVAVYGFAPIGTGENGEINPFNDYGKTKFEAEKIFQSWHDLDSKNRTLVIVRPTVVFGEQNRGNVYNLLAQIASGKFLMIGNGLNRKSIAYVENISAFLEWSSANLAAGKHVFNYVDKPDFTMNELISSVRLQLGKGLGVGIRLPRWCGLLAGSLLDMLAGILNRKFPLSRIRVEKFCADSVYSSKVDASGFLRPVSIEQALSQTLSYEFLNPEKEETEIFYGSQ
ncbi:NAD-dependent epimerase/dehydratase family protein [Sandaracinobacter neustonicus]|uniref:NAD-dependent epimerase/dehydratase family protein n=2 Tax=Sandaracinobacter neustonicus TaxID=1715348 RepID=A0A501XV95_9SPHN|nr:NAD-dependent epimerase/dehydratase family protein [Sandaracinobacter neustonicus]